MKIGVVTTSLGPSQLTTGATIVQYIPRHLPNFIEKNMNIFFQFCLSSTLSSGSFSGFFPGTPYAFVSRITNKYEYLHQS